MSQIRLSLYAAAQEFDIHRETLGKRLNAQSIKPDEKNEYSIADCCKAIYGDLDGEKLLLTREQRIDKQRENARKAKELIPSELVQFVWSRTMIEYRQRVMASDIPRELKDELLEILSETTVDEYFEAAIKSMERDPDGVSDAA